MKFEIMFEFGSSIKKLVESVESLVSESHLIVDSNGFLIKAMDGNHICLIHLKVNKNDCSSFLFEGKEQIEVGLNFEDLSKILKRSTEKDFVRLSFNSSSPHKELSIEVIKAKIEELDMNEEQKHEYKIAHPKSRVPKLKIRSLGSKAKTFTMGLIDVDSEDFNLDSLCQFSQNMVLHFKINGEELDEIVKDSEIYSEVLGIGLKGENLIFSAEGSIGKYKNPYKINELSDFEGRDSDFSCNYAIGFIKNILKSNGLTEKSIQIGLQGESPLYLKYSIWNESTIEYFLAPRVEDNEEEETPVKVESPKIESSNLKPIIKVDQIRINAILAIGEEIDDIESDMESTNASYNILKEKSKIENDLDKTMEYLSEMKVLQAKGKELLTYHTSLQNLFENPMLIV